MRIAVFLLAILVFGAGLILDTGAVLALVGGLLSWHAVTAAAVSLVVVAVIMGWGWLRRRKGAAKTRGRAGAPRRPAGQRQKQVSGGRGQRRAGKNARAG
jgi:membrane protein implicated in regulation of membrane protease activity